MGEVIQHFRKSIKIEPVTSLITDKRTGRSVEILTAFIISYEGETPHNVQKVANNLAKLYIEGDTINRGRRASATTVFFQEELDRLKIQIREYEEKISQFKQDHIGELPEYNTINMRAVNQMELEANRLLSRKRNLEDKKIQIENLLANIDPLSPIFDEKGKLVSSPNERIQQLRLQLIDLQANFSEKHPDIIRLKRAIENLEAQGQESNEEADKIKRLRSLRIRRTELEGEYGPQHPDVVSVDKSIKMLQHDIETNVLAEETNDEIDKNETADNPKYRELKTQLKIIDNEIESIQHDEKEIQKEIVRIQNKIEIAPIVEKEYNEIARDYETAKRKYNELMDKLMQAKVAQGIDEKQKGERFSVVDSAPFPEKPYKPNRKAILILGFVLALGISSMVVILLETFDNSVKTAEDLFKISGIPVISIIGNIETQEEKRKKRIKKYFIIIGILIFLGLSIILYFQMIGTIDKLVGLVRQMML